MENAAQTALQVQDGDFFLMLHRSHCQETDE